MTYVDEVRARRVRIDADQEERRARRMARVADYYAGGLLTWADAAERMEHIALGIA